MAKKAIRISECLTSCEWLNRYVLEDNHIFLYSPTLEEVEAMGLDKWNYPLDEVDHILENDIDVVLVAFPNKGGEGVYRFCEV